MDVPVITLTCERCGHEWTPRRPQVSICPKCKSAKWNVPKAAQA